MWVPPETKDPILLHHPTRKKIGYFGAVRLRDGRFVFRREENIFNGETCFRFLRRMSRASCQSGRFVVVVADNARYHHALLHGAWRAKATPRFSMAFLPPYSPELNPIERVWKLTRRLATHNQYFSTLDSLTDVVEQTFETWSKGNETLRRLCAVT
jgi:transposase